MNVYTGGTQVLRVIMEKKGEPPSPIVIWWFEVALGRKPPNRMAKEHQTFGRNMWA